MWQSKFGYFYNRQTHRVKIGDIEEKMANMMDVVADDKTTTAKKNQKKNNEAYAIWCG